MNGTNYLNLKIFQGYILLCLKPTANTIESFVSFMERRHVERNFIASDELNKRFLKITISPRAGDFEPNGSEQYFKQYSEIVSEISEPLYIGMTGNLAAYRNPPKSIQ